MNKRQGHGFVNMKQAEVATALGVSAKTVSIWTRQGCPRNQDGTYNLSAVFKWRVEKASGDTNELLVQRRRLEVERLEKQIERLAQQIDEGNSLFMLKSEHTEIIRGLIVNLKNYWLAGVRKVAHEFIGCPDAVSAQNILDQFVRYGLNGMVGK